MSRSFRVRIRRWHRSIGALAAIAVLWLVITGVGLNHAPGMGLDRAAVSSGWILDRYGIEIDPPQQGWQLGSDWISYCAGRVYLNDRALAPSETLVGATQLDDLLLIASAASLQLFDAQGFLIERLDAEALPGRLQALTRVAAQVAVRTDAGWFLSDSSLLSWAPTEAQFKFQAATPLPPQLAGAVAVTARSHELNWERVVADLHSGRLFGRWGPWIVDGAALALALLALSGFWLWARSGRHP